MGIRILYMCWQKQPEQNNLSKIRIHVFKINTFVFLAWVWFLWWIWCDTQPESRRKGVRSGMIGRDSNARVAHSFIHWPGWLVVWFIWLTCEYEAKAWAWVPPFNCHFRRRHRRRKMPIIFRLCIIVIACAFHPIRVPFSYFHLHLYHSLLSMCDVLFRFFP